MSRWKVGLQLGRTAFFSKNEPHTPLFTQVLSYPYVDNIVPEWILLPIGVNLPVALLNAHILP